MKKLFMFIVFISVLFGSFATDFERGKIIYKNGSVREGYIQLLNGGEKKILFKVEEKSEPEKIISDSLVTIKYEKGAEYDYVRKYSAKVFGGFGKLQEPMWMEVVQRGFVTVYTYCTRLQVPNIPKAGGLTFSGGSATFIDYFVMRKTELGIKLISTEASLNSNFNFKYYGQRYFSDYPELAEKIKKKTYTYKNLLEVVDIYNKWIGEKVQNKE